MYKYIFIWKVQFRQWFAQINNIDWKTTWKKKKKINYYINKIQSTEDIHKKYYVYIYMIWAIIFHDMGTWHKNENFFFDYANNTHPNNTFTCEAATALPLLDVLIKINNNTIYTTVYSRPSHRHSYNHY